jgi:NAD(P)H-hydrate epimerase
MQTITALPALPPRASDANKGNFGRILIVAGSRGMSGAAILCGCAALRAGAGLVRVAAPAEIQPIVAAGNPCYMTEALPNDEQGRISASSISGLKALSEANDVLAIGPGLGRSADISKMVAYVIARIIRTTIIDADGLNALAGTPEDLDQRPVTLAGVACGPLIITPHPGEFARLLQTDVKTVQANRSDLAAEFAAKHNLVVVLKGQGTIVTDGRRVYQNTTGNPGMATGGTGDILTGVIAALLGQRLPPFEAAQLGVHLHGLAGDLARDQIGEVSLIATDLLDFLPPAIRHFQGG